MKSILHLTLIIISMKSFSQNFDVYVSDAGNFNSPPWQILKFDSAGQNPSVFISANLNWPQDILFLEDSGTVLISNLGSGKIIKCNASDGSYISDFATGLGGPTRMKLGPDSLLYVLQWTGDGLVKKYFLDGTFAGDFTSVPVSQSIGMDWDQSGNFYVSSYNGHYIRKFDSNGIDLGLFVDSNISGPTNIWFNSNGELLVNDYNAAAVKKFDGTGNYIGDFVPAIGSAEGVDFLPNGNILIGSGFSHSVKMYDSNGNFINDFIPSGSGNLLTPNAIVVRESVSTSVNELHSKQKSFVHPTIGSEFYFSENIDHYKKVMLYSIEGKFIKSIYSENNVWKAENIEPGFYVIRIIYKNDSVEQEKIYIK